MAKLTVFFLLIFLAVLSLLSFFNKETVNLTVWKGVTFEGIPLIGLIFICTAAGIISMFFLSAIRDARRHIENWQIRRKSKREAKVLESYIKGREAFFACRYEEAAVLFKAVLEHDHIHFNSLLRLGDISVSNKEYVAAEEFYLRAKEVKPKSMETLLSLERLAEIQHRWTEAIEYLDAILEIDSDNIMTLYKKRDIYERIREWEDLIDVQNKILKCKLSPGQQQEEDKKLLGYKYELGNYYIETGSLDKAIKTLKYVIKADKYFTAAYLLLVDAHLKDGNNKEALADLMKGYEENPSMVFLVRLEDYFIDEGEPGTIIDIYQKAIQKNPKDLRIQFFLAKLYYRLEMIDYALETINAIDITVFAYPDLHALLGSIYERHSEYKKASEEYKKALNVDLLIPYCCSSCKYISKDWSGRCPECKNWNTFILDVNEICKVKKRQSSP
ncbi:MAG: tetratricopeptide repeat protein [Nitrospirae bacterium]|nr:tetratricopeptide repeat protein [Nitrospirota bacterium]